MHITSCAPLLPRTVQRRLVLARLGFRLLPSAVSVAPCCSDPHRGFETVTVVRRGIIDHHDSMGASGRFGEGGDVQWMTAGRGISHSEMFPLLNTEASNPLELFQIWLNLPRASKMAEPHFTMLWSEDIPTVTRPSDDGGTGSVRLTLVTGRGFLGDEVESKMPRPPPNSWASGDNDVGIMMVSLPQGAAYELPPARGGDSTNRMLYFFEGNGLFVDGHLFSAHSHVHVKAGAAVVLKSPQDGPAQVLVLQGKPIGEPVVQHGPFVGNERADIIKAFEDYQRDEFGGWPHAGDAPVHDRSRKRFAQHPDGTLEEKAWPAGAFAHSR